MAYLHGSSERALVHALRESSAMAMAVSPATRVAASVAEATVGYMTGKYLGGVSSEVNAYAFDDVEAVRTMKLEYVEIIAKSSLGPITRMRDEHGNHYICKAATKPSLLSNIPPHPNIAQLLHQVPFENQWLLLLSSSAPKWLFKQDPINCGQHLLLQCFPNT